MKKLLIFLIFSVYTYCTYAQSAVNPNQMENALSITELNAYQKKAEQKIKDFVAMLTIISTPNYDKTLREKSVKNCLKWFEYENTNVSGLPNATKPTAIKTYLSGLLTITTLSKPLVITTIVAQSPMKPTRSGEYIGMYKITFENNAPLLIQVKIKSREKSFGSEIKTVKEVLISEIKKQS